MKLRFRISNGISANTGNFVVTKTVDIVKSERLFVAVRQRIDSRLKINSVQDAHEIGIEGAGIGILQAFRRQLAVSLFLGA